MEQTSPKVGHFSTAAADCYRAVSVCYRTSAWSSPRGPLRVVLSRTRPRTCQPWIDRL